MGQYIRKTASSCPKHVFQAIRNVDNTCKFHRAAQAPSLESLGVSYYAQNRIKLGKKHFFVIISQDRLWKPLQRRRQRRSMEFTGAVCISNGLKHLFGTARSCFADILTYKSKKRRAYLKMLDFDSNFMTFYHFQAHLRWKFWLSEGARTLWAAFWPIGAPLVYP